jgi:hypothetical protein
MKRLTISMSDDLFDSLSEIQNKSLFVRNLLEQGLDAGFGEEGAVPSSRDMDALRNEIGKLTDRLHGLEDQVNAIHSTLQSIQSDRKTEAKSTSAIETKTLHDETVQDIKPAGEIPAFSPIAAPEKQSDETTGSPFVIPDLKLPEEPTSEPSIVMQDLETAEEISSSSSIAESGETSNESAQPPLSISGSRLPEKMTQSSFFSQSPDLPAFEPPQMETVPSPIPSSTKPADKKDRLEGNILMYMPHGAEIKRDIIKSLLSTRYDSDEIDTKINQMIADNTLSAVTREGKDYLVRL